MAPDQIYQPIVSDDDDQSETPSPRTELQIENPAEFRKKPDEGDDLTAEEATAQRSRRPDPESAESAYERPITVHKVKGDGPISVNEATDAMRWSRAYKLGASCARRASASDRSTRWRPTRLRAGNELTRWRRRRPKLKFSNTSGKTNKSSLRLKPLTN